MHPFNTAPAFSYSDLPVLCIPVICRQLGQAGPAPVVRIRTVNHDFHDHSRTALAEAIHEQLKQVTSTRFEKPETRLDLFRRPLRALKDKDYLPAHFRQAVFSELCRIVNTLPNQFFHSGWRELVGQFNSESEAMRNALQADMDKCAARVELYGDGGVNFNFKSPAW